MKSMVGHIRTYEPEKLVDTLIIGAIIEARSCERFAALAPYLDDELKEFYTRLLRSESRHFTTYLGMAEKYSPKNIDDRVDFFLRKEDDLIYESDTLFRFHSGSPCIDQKTSNPVTD
jgi:tRNA-(ms[2]io[6]A)-hydroxylase